MPIRQATAAASWLWHLRALSRSRAIRVVLAFFAIFAAAGLGLRMYLGPTHIGNLSIGSPLGCESLFAIAILLIVCLRSNVEAPDYLRGKSPRAVICVVG